MNYQVFLKPTITGDLKQLALGITIGSCTLLGYDVADATVGKVFETIWSFSLKTNNRNIANDIAGHPYVKEVLESD